MHAHRSASHHLARRWEQVRRCLANDPTARGAESVSILEVEDRLPGFNGTRSNRKVIARGAMIVA